MKLFTTVTLLAAIAAAVNLQHTNEAEIVLAETEVEVADDDNWRRKDCKKCRDHSDSDSDCDYYCPPALERCPGVLQPPGPCKTALKARPLCYCNNGFMHTDWDHNISVDCEACKNCGHKGKRGHRLRGGSDSDSDFDARATPDLADQPAE